VIAAINRAISPNSKRSMWEWFCQTILLRRLPHASKSAMNSQRFWDHMDRIKDHMALTIWKNILKGVFSREAIDISSVSYDGTNFYTFIDTFNVRCQIAKRGKNKQGRNNLRQVSYALFCCADGHMPLFYDIYDGNRNDAKQFPLMVKKFHDFLNEIWESQSQSQLQLQLQLQLQSQEKKKEKEKEQAQELKLVPEPEEQPRQPQPPQPLQPQQPQVTLIFDKGNNSAENFNLIDSLNLNYVGSVKLEEHKELAQISNNDDRFQLCKEDEDEEDELEGTKFFQVKKVVYGKERILVVTYNQNLFNAQYLTIQNDITKAIEKLSLLRQKLEDRVNGLIKGGKSPTKESVEKQCKKILRRQYMKDVIKIKIAVQEEQKERKGKKEQKKPNGTETVKTKTVRLVHLEYWIDSEAMSKLSDTYLGKNIIITNHEGWDNCRIIKAYRSQFIIENIFKEMKDRKTGSWWPLHHWTDSKIRVHALYCTIALLIRALMYRRINLKGLNLSMKRVLKELDAIRETINIYPAKRGKGNKKQPTQPVLTKISEVQQKLIEILNLKEEKSGF
jgi:transposase